MNQLSLTKSRSNRRKTNIGLSFAAAALSCILPAGRAGEEVAPQSAPASSASQSNLIREGTRIVDRQAVCRSSGDQLLIDFTAEAEPLVALENLAAQRILKAVMDDAGDETWIVNGQITEFQGHNYILLNRVNRKPKQNLGATVQKQP